jgi:hypothetical protein
MNQKLIEAFGREAQALRRLAKSGSNRKLVEHLVAVYERGLRDGVQLAEELRNAKANSIDSTNTDRERLEP